MYIMKWGMIRDGNIRLLLKYKIKYSMYIIFLWKNGQDNRKVMFFLRMRIGIFLCIYIKLGMEEWKQFG